MRRPICAIGSILFDGPDGLVKEGSVLSATCGVWNCPDCGSRKARELQIRLHRALEQVHQQELAWLRQQGREEAEAWHPFKLLTLTVGIRPYIGEERYRSKDWDARPEDLQQAVRDLMQAFNRLLTWLRWLKRQRPSPCPAAWEGNGTAAPYFWVLELTRHGWPHLHVIVLWRQRFSRADVATIRGLWKKYDIGQSVHLANRNRNHQHPGSFAAYLTKYLRKSLHSGRIPTGARRWSSSRGFLRPRIRGPRAHQAGYSQASVALHRLERTRAGAEIRDTSRGFDYTLEGRPQPIGALTAAVAHALGVNAAELTTFAYPGLTFAERSHLEDGDRLDFLDGDPLFVPIRVRGGIQRSCGRSST